MEFTCELIVPCSYFVPYSMRPAIPKTGQKRMGKQPAPGATAVYSGTPLPKKLGIRENYSFLLVNAPERFERKLEPPINHKGHEGTRRKIRRARGWRCCSLGLKLISYASFVRSRRVCLKKSRYGLRGRRRRQG
jgi:hypothetical protein